MSVRKSNVEHAPAPDDRSVAYIGDGRYHALRSLAMRRTGRHGSAKAEGRERDPGELEDVVVLGEK